MDCSAALLIDENEYMTVNGEVQFTDYGLSGIPVFQLSRYAVRSIEANQQVAVVLDFMPDFSKEQLVNFLESRRQNCSYKTLEELLIGLIPAKLIPVLCRKGSSVTELAARMKRYPVPIKSAHSLETAQVCSGGVDTCEVSPETLESKIQPGLFFAGEVLDVDGECGGYNLQWAWSSGAIAGAVAADAPIPMKGG